MRKLSSVRRYSFGHQSSILKQQTIENDFEPTIQQRQNSISARYSFNNTSMEQNQIDSIPSLPLYSLLMADKISDQIPFSQQTQIVTKNSLDITDVFITFVFLSFKIFIFKDSNIYDSLFARSVTEEENFNFDEDDFEDQSDEERKNSISRSRKFSIGSLNEANFLFLANTGSPQASKFTTNHARYLTDILTHTHLHGYFIFNFVFLLFNFRLI